MKKLFVAMLAAFTVFFVMPTVSQAQIVKTIATSKASLSGADTANATIPVEATIKSVQFGGTKTSGTVGGKIYLQGLTLDGGTYVNLDSLTISNTAGLQYKLVAFHSALPLIYQSYRFYYLSTGGVWVPKAYYLRRN
jgi:hypothetical protein